ncbi:hypothetical protein [Kribbella sp. NPDC048915]|uniref:hypothetical protein n=1 Tax=Kribbella sp. NPDC048915 TaxID=3155148 RepID=UPI0033DD3E49
MRNLSRYATVAVIAGFVLTGCGSEGEPGTGSTPTPTASQSTPTGTALPLTVSRTGGFAGFNEKVHITADGVATVTDRKRGTLRCRLDATLLSELTTAAQQVDWTKLPATKPTTRHPDDLVIAVTSNGRTARIEDPILEPLTAPVTELFTEAAIPPGKRCTKF